MRKLETEKDDEILFSPSFKKNLMFERDNYVDLWETLLDGQNNPQTERPTLIEVSYMDLESGEEKKQLMSREELKELGFDWVDDREDIDSCIVFE
jgi:hypothetical protein